MQLSRGLVREKKRDLSAFLWLAAIIISASATITAWAGAGYYKKIGYDVLIGSRLTASIPAVPTRVLYASRYNGLPPSIFRLYAAAHPGSRFYKLDLIRHDSGGHVFPAWYQTYRSWDSCPRGGFKAGDTLHVYDVGIYHPLVIKECLDHARKSFFWVLICFFCVPFFAFVTWRLWQSS